MLLNLDTLIKCMWFLSNLPLRKKANNVSKQTHELRLCTFQQKGIIKVKNITKLDASVISVLFSAFSNNTYKKNTPIAFLFHKNIFLITTTTVSKARKTDQSPLDGDLCTMLWGKEVRGLVCLCFSMQQHSTSSL